MAKKIKRPKRVRVNMRVPKDLLDWAKDYVRSENKTLTQEFIDYWMSKKKKVLDGELRTS